MKKHALVVGIGSYTDPEITDLAFAARDAEEIGHVLADICGFDEVRTLASGGPQEPDHVNVVDALHGLAPLLSPDDLFLFYFAGHGIETRTGAHLLTSNSRIRMPELASVSKEVLSDCLSRIECADRVLILDACRNDPRKGMGDQDNLLTSGFSRDIMAVAETPVEGVIPTTCVLFSCRPGERAYEWPDMRHGAFSHYLLEGLRGAAADAGGCITVQALGRYVEAQVPRWAKKAGTPRPQTPWGEHKGSWREISLAARVAPSPRAQPRPVHPPKPVTILAEPVLHVETNPSGASLSVDGRVLGPAPQRFPLRAGEYRIRAEMDGYKPWDRRIRYDAASDAQLRIELEAKPRVVEASFPMTVEEATGVQRAAAEVMGILLTDDLNCGKGIKLPLILIPSGTFIMGSPKDEHDRFDDEGPQHEVTISKPFYMGVTPVTQGQYKSMTGDKPSYFKGDSNSVEQVPWDQASRFCVKMTSTTGKVVRLPTEAEWEYACRAGSATRFSFGNEDAGLALHAWYTSNSGSSTHPVGQKKPNAWGLYDMHGNVWEWCEDAWHVSYKNAPTDGSAWVGGESARVVRGGGWYFVPQYCRSSLRDGVEPDYRFFDVGFRVVVDLE